MIGPDGGSGRARSATAAGVGVTPIIEVTVPGYPHPLMRARSKDGQDQHYDPPENVAAKQKIQLFTRYGGRPVEASLRVDIWFMYRRANPTADVDNLAKTVLDAYNGYLWKDDRQIMDLVVHKRGGRTEDCTIIHVEEIP